MVIGSTVFGGVHFQLGINSSKSTRANPLAHSSTGNHFGATAPAYGRPRQKHLRETYLPQQLYNLARDRDDLDFGNCSGSDACLPATEKMYNCVNTLQPEGNA